MDKEILMECYNIVDEAMNESFYYYFQEHKSKALEYKNGLLQAFKDVIERTYDEVMEED